MSQSSWVQVLVKASGKKARSTFRPRSEESVTGFPEVEGRVKSGASEPTAGTGEDMETWVVVVSTRGCRQP
jgi:hypothetical protein